jgi:hypothetical protein
VAFDILSGRLIIQALVDTPNLSHPTLPLAVLHLHDLVIRPVQMVRNIRYLLVQAIRGVARYPPRPAVSTSNSPWQCGQATSNRVCPLVLTR